MMMSFNLLPNLMVGANFFFFSFSSHRLLYIYLSFNNLEEKIINIQYTHMFTFWINNFCIFSFSFSVQRYKTTQQATWFHNEVAREDTSETEIEKELYEEKERTNRGRFNINQIDVWLNFNRVISLQKAATPNIELLGHC